MGPLAKIVLMAKFLGPTQNIVLLDRGLQRLECLMAMREIFDGVFASLVSDRMEAKGKYFYYISHT